MTHQTVVITSCTARKRGNLDLVSLAEVNPGPTLASTANRWRSLLSARTTRALVRELYAGRSFTEARRVANKLTAPMFVVSAGLGLVGLEDRVPPYDATVAVHESHLNTLLTHHSSNLEDWWMAINGGPALAPLLHCYSTALVLIALPATYLQMVAQDLLSSTPDALQRLRIFTSSAGRRALPSPLADVTLPYDDRLEKVAGFAGTQSDFAQRSLRHFVEAVSGHKVSIEDGRRLVGQALAGLSRRAGVPRSRMSDDEIRQLIRENWAAHRGQSSRLLRYLRDDAKVACEQGRFVQLWRRVRSEMATLESGHEQRVAHAGE